MRPTSEIHTNNPSCSLFVKWLWASPQNIYIYQLNNSESPICLSNGFSKFIQNHWIKYSQLFDWAKFFQHHLKNYFTTNEQLGSRIQDSGVGPHTHLVQYVQEGFVPIYRTVLDVCVRYSSCFQLFLSLRSISVNIFEGSIFSAWKHCGYDFGGKLCIGPLPCWDKVQLG